MGAQLHLHAIKQHGQCDTTLVGVTLNLIASGDLRLTPGQKNVVGRETLPFALFGQVVDVLQ